MKDFNFKELRQKSFVKKPQRILLIALGAVTALSLIVACSKNDGGSADSVPTTVVDPMAWTGGQIGFYSQNSNMDKYFYNVAGATMTPASAYIKVLKTAMRTCDRGNSNGGQAACTAWLNGLNDIMIFANSAQASTVQMVIRSMYDSSCTSAYSCTQYWYSMPSFSQFILGLFGFNSFNNSNVYNPMILNMTIWPINNSKGFELRGYAPGYDLYYNSGGLLFQFIVTEGKLTDLSWNYQLVFNGETAATGRMARCPSTNCGIARY